MLRLPASGIMTGGWKWAGDFTTLDLIAAGTNASNGALLATGGPPGCPGKSQREPRDLGLLVEPDDNASGWAEPSTEDQPFRSLVPYASASPEAW